MPLRRETGKTCIKNITRLRFLHGPFSTSIRRAGRNNEAADVHSYDAAAWLLKEMGATEN